jgi:hypothetical protein
MLFQTYKKPIFGALTHEQLPLPESSLFSVNYEESYDFSEF